MHVCTVNFLHDGLLLLNHSKGFLNQRRDFFLWLLAFLHARILGNALAQRSKFLFMVGPYQKSFCQLHVNLSGQSAR